MVVTMIGIDPIINSAFINNYMVQQSLLCTRLAYGDANSYDKIIVPR